MNPLFLSAASSAPSPGDAVLIIYVNEPYDVTVKNNIEANLNAMPAAQRPTITELMVPLGSKVGIAPLIGSANKLGYLLQFCQVWDLRFMQGNNASSYSGTVQEDTITSGCGACDQELYQQFLANGGHLFLLGDHSEYYARNEGLISFLGTATGTPITYPSITTATVYWTTHDNTAPDNFNTNFVNPIGSFGSYYPGFIPTGGWGAGKALTYNGSGALTIEWLPAQLTAGNGKLIVTFDTNGFARDANITAASNDDLGYTQNLYTALSTCYNYTVGKSVDNPGPVCIGTTIHFTVCTTNTGTRALPVQTMYDTIPTCFTYLSANPAPAGSAGNYYTWSVPALSAGQSYCATVAVQVANGGPCP